MARCAHSGCEAAGAATAVARVQGCVEAIQTQCLAFLQNVPECRPKALARINGLASMALSSGYGQTPRSSWKEGARHAPLTAAGGRFLSVLCVHYGHVATMEPIGLPNGASPCRTKPCTLGGAVASFKCHRLVRESRPWPRIGPGPRRHKMLRRHRQILHCQAAHTSSTILGICRGRGRVPAVHLPGGGR